MVCGGAGVMPLPSGDALLRIDRLTVSFPTKFGMTPVVRNLSLSIQRGEIVGLLGESGCGKTTTALAILGLQTGDAVVHGSVRFRETELVGAAEETLHELRGARISLIFQEPSLSLNPVLRVIDQVEQVLKAHERLSAPERRRKARASLEQVGLATDRLQESYPHQLSGGQRQRVLIAQAIVCGPSLIIADEPANSLDAIASLQVFTLLRDQVRRLNASLLLITHDPRTLLAIADRVLVMYAGTIVESGPASEVLDAPLHPYTRALLSHVAIEGAAPDFQALPPGCTFAPRCLQRTPVCTEAEPLLAALGSREVRCILHAQ